MKFKLLEKKFGYRELEKLCARKGYSIPSSEDALNKSVETDYFWIIDMPERQDRESHALTGNCFGKKRLVNKNNLSRAVVIVKDTSCNNCLHMPKEGENYPEVCGICREFYDSFFEEK